MKLRFLLSLLAVCSFAGAANAQTTYIEITGATAFRSAAITAINAAFLAGSGAGNFTTAYANTTASGHFESVWARR